MTAVERSGRLRRFEHYGNNGNLRFAASMTMMEDPKGPGNEYELAIGPNPVKFSYEPFFEFMKFLARVVAEEEPSGPKLVDD